MPSASPPIDFPGLNISSNVYFHLGANGEEPAIRERYDPEPQVTCLFKCGWNDRFAFIQYLLGTVQYTNNGTITRTPPFSYPLPQAQFLAGTMKQDRWICTSIGEVSGIKWRTDQDGSSTGTNLEGWGEYDTAIVPATFTVPLWQTSPQGQGAPFCDPFNNSYAVTKIKTSGEVFAPPTGSLFYNAGAYANQPLQDINGAVIRTRDEISITRIRIPILPNTALLACQSGVNNAQFDVGSKKYERGSVLFVSKNVESRPDPTNFGIVFDIEYIFLANAPTQQANLINQALDWNYFMDPTGAWVQVQQNPTSPIDVFPYCDFSTLFSNTIS